MRSLRSSRVAGFALCFGLASLVAPTLAYRALEATGTHYSGVGLDLVWDLRRPLRVLRESRDRGGIERVAILGGSTVVSYPDGRRIADRLAEAANRATRGDPPVQVFQLAIGGMGPFDYYFIADVIASARPDQALLAFNLGSFGEGWRTRLTRPELAGFVRPARLGEAIRLPLHWIGLTTDQLLFYSTLIASGGYQPWRRLLRQQVRLGSVRSTLEEWVGDAVGAQSGAEFEDALNRARLRRIVLPENGRRYNRQQLRFHYAPALDGVDGDHPVLRVFAATLSLLERNGIRTLVFTVPMNIEHIDLMGLYAEEGLARTLGAVETTVRESGSHFVDLHDLLPDSAFRDAAGHFTVDGPIDGPARVAAVLTPLVAAEARNSRGAGH
jgi:hypothetical protein